MNLTKQNTTPIPPRKIQHHHPVLVHFLQYPLHLAQNACIFRIRRQIHMLCGIIPHIHQASCTTVHRPCLTIYFLWGISQRNGFTKDFDLSNGLEFCGKKEDTLELLECSPTWMTVALKFSDHCWKVGQHQYRPSMVLSFIPRSAVLLDDLETLWMLLAHCGTSSSAPGA